MDEEEIQLAVKTEMELKFKDTQANLKKLQEDSTSTKSSIEKATKQIIEQGELLQEFMEANKKAEKNDFNSELEVFLKENIDEINNIRTAKAGSVLFTPKAVDDVTTSNGTSVGTRDPNDQARLSPINYRNDSALLNACTRFNTSTPQVPYTEVSPKDGGYAVVAEGGLKPEIDFDWITRYASPVKAAAWTALSDEVVTDIPRIMSVARGNLKDRHDLFKTNLVYFGTGVGANPTGATVSAGTFVAGASALAVPTPNSMDAINAGITDIFTSSNFVDEAQYFPNTVLISPWDFFLKFQSAKDANGLPLYPQASLFNTVNIGGVTIRPWVKIPTGKVFIGDMKKMNVSNYVPYSVRIGWVNDQLIKNMFTIVGESRFHQYIENFNVKAFTYDTLATMETAITAA